MDRNVFSCYPLPEDLFELVPYHRVVYILGEEKMAIEEAAEKAPA